MGITAMLNGNRDAAGPNPPTIDPPHKPSLLESIERFQRNLAIKVGQPALGALTWMETTAQRIGQATVRAAEVFAPWAAQVGDFLDSAIKVIIELHEAYEAFGPVMLQLGWPPPTDFDVVERKQFVEAYNQYYQANPVAFQRELDQLILHRYDQTKLEDLLATWGEKKWLARRIPILRAALTAHVAGQYVLSIPAILPQIEGMIADGFAHEGEMHQRQYKNYLTKLLNPKALLLQYPEQINQFMLDVILASFQHGFPIGSPISRHAILHGADTAYGTAINSLKVILLFNYIQDAFRLISTPGGRCYHLMGCPKVSTTARKRLILYSTSLEASEDKRRPCKVCLGGEAPEEF